MANDVQTATEPSLASLVTGIVGDVQDLIKQQIAMLRQELRDDFKKTRGAATPLIIGLVVCLVGGIVLCFFLAHLLEWLFRPDLPLWACFGIVGGVITGVGGALAYTGLKKFQTFNPLPDRTVAALEENIQWMTNKK